MEPVAPNDDNYNVDELIRESQAKIDHEIAEQFALVSEIFDVSKLHDEYSSEDAVYQEKVKDLVHLYEKMRKTRPDGNCFFRAFIFAYFESLLSDDKEIKRFLEICSVTRKGISSLGFQDFTVDEFYDYFNEIVQSINEKKITNSQQLLAELDKPSVSDNIVVYLRLLTSYYLQKESNFFSNFIEGSGQISEFCKREVEPMYKESDHIHIIALSSVLDVTVRVIYMDRAPGGKVTVHDFKPIHESSSSNNNTNNGIESNNSTDLLPEEKISEPRIHLLYRPGHYDILYKNTF